MVREPSVQSSFVRISCEVANQSGFGGICTKLLKAGLHVFHRRVLSEPRATLHEQLRESTPQGDAHHSSGEWLQLGLRMLLAFGSTAILFRHFEHDLLRPRLVC